MSANQASAPKVIEAVAAHRASVGSSKAHDSAARHVRGAADYADDIAAPEGCLHAELITSSVARGKLIELDLSATLDSPGVRCVLQARDVPGVNDIGAIVADEPLLAEDEVHYHGQVIALVIADSVQQARRASLRARASYQELTPLLDPLLAYERGKLLSPDLTFSKGDVQRQLERGPRVLELEYQIGGQEHFYLEGQVALAIPGEDDELEVISATQHPSEVQQMVARVLDVSVNQINVRVRRMGGGFGGKETQATFVACLAALAAKRTGRAVKLRLDRDQDIQTTGKRHPFVYRAKVAFNERGDILALDALLLANGGWSNDLTNPVVDRAMLHVDNAYCIPHMRVTGARVMTNTCSNTAFRGFGGPQGVYLVEQVIDDVARHLGLDPALVRRRNLYGSAGRNLTHYGQKVETGFLRPMFQQLYTSGAYRRVRQQVRRFNKRNQQFKQGLALTPVKYGISFTLTKYNRAGALINIYGDGSVQLNHGGTEMGQGLFVKVAQVVAEELGISLERIRPMTTNTAKIPNTSATAASSGSDLNGMAARDAARQLKQRLSAWARQLWQLPSTSAITFRDNQVAAGEHSLSFAELVQSALDARLSLSAVGDYQTPKINWDRSVGRGRPFYYYACGVAMSRVIIDTLTGEYKLLSTRIVHDVGASLNPAVDIGQIEGAFVQGVGWLTCEQLHWDDRGCLQTHAPATYKIPTARERPEQFDVELFAKPNSQPTIYRSKAVGEPPFVLAFAVFMAIKDAVAAHLGGAGARVQLNAPATPEAILMALQRR